MMMITTTGPEPSGTTPLGEDEAADLIPAHLGTRAEVNAWEQINISQAVDWLRRRRREPLSALNASFLFELHRRMFGETWRWAGRPRTTEKSIGIAPHQIAEALGNLLADAQYWIEHETRATDEIATRFHHRLVAIHPFPNGNGRHARLAADILLESLGGVPFTWGSADLDREGDAGSRYLDALRQADKGSLTGLLAFVRS